MMRTDNERQEGPDPASDRLLWQRSRMIDAPEDEAAQLFDLAAFADGLLDPEERDRVAAWLADDPDAAADVRRGAQLDGCRSELPPGSSG